MFCNVEFYKLSFQGHDFLCSFPFIIVWAHVPPAIPAAISGGSNTKVEAEPALAQTRLLMADPHKMPFADELFDRVIYIGELTDFREPDAVRKEMLRVVKADGMVFPA